MSDNLDQLIKALRAASEKDSVTPDQIGFLLQAIRAETTRLIANVASSGQVDLSPITSQLSELDAKLSDHIRASSGFSDKIRALESDVLRAKSQITELENTINEGQISVEAPALLPFYGIASDGVNALNASTTLKTRAIYDAKNGRFVAQAANANGVFPILPSAGTFYLGGNMVKYNSAGKARTDLLFVFDKNLYSFDGTELINHTERPA